jgi:alpha/beta superfamily hydrolase
MGDVRELWIKGPAGKLQAAMRSASPARASAVLSHPHPLQGGSLHNPVVFHSERGLNRAGLTTMRFNFRGVGSSEGEYDEGRGEVDDVAAACHWTRGIAARGPLLLVGYSFGAWCGIRYAVRDPKVAALIAIGLPVTKRFPLPELEQLRCPLIVVQGSQDEFGSPDEVRARLGRCKPDAELRVVDGTGHLFPDRARDAAKEVTAAAQELLESL